MNRILNIALTLVSTIILLTGSARALTVVSSAQLKTITGQAGITLTAKDTLGLNWSADKIVYGDSDGTNGIPGFLSFNNVEYVGDITFKNPVMVRASNEIDPYTGTMKSGMNVEMNGAVVKIDRYHIGSITIEGEDGAGRPYANAGKSFGSITVEGFSAEISGKIRITSN